MSERHTAPPPAELAKSRSNTQPLRVVAALVLIAIVFAVGVVVGQGVGGVPPGAIGPTRSAGQESPTAAPESPTNPPSSPGTSPTDAPPSPGASPTDAPSPAVTASPVGPGTQPPDAPADFALFWEALEIIRSKYVGRDQLDDKQLTYGAIRGLVDSLGDTGHSVFLTPEALQRELESLQGRVVGVGALLGERDGRPVIVSVVSGGPASRAGMRSGDHIIAVDGVDVADRPPHEVASLVRGEAGTTVVVTIFRPSTNETIDLTMVREEINFPSASGAFIPGTRIALLRLIQFSDGAGAQLRLARDEAIAQGATGLVLDLRSNPGGFVHEAVNVASLFLDGRTVYIRELASGERIAVTTDPSVPATDLPLVVLIDQGTASAAEIVSGAIRSAGRAELVGETTFGTGTVLNTVPLADGSAVRIAVERWLTPDGELIFEQGIAPTIELPMPDDGRALDPQEVAALEPGAIPTMEDVQLRRAIELLQPAAVPQP